MKKSLQAWLGLKTKETLSRERVSIILKRFCFSKNISLARSINITALRAISLFAEQKYHLTTFILTFFQKTLDKTETL